MLSSNDGWWNYWNDWNFDNSLKNGLNNLYGTKYILWKYENSLREKAGKELLRYTDIKDYQVEHIAPQTESQGDNTGYPKYDENFTWEDRNSFGNLMLLSSKTNERIQNNPLIKKIEEYRNEGEKSLLQQKEVIDIATQKQEYFWGKDEITKRTEEIIAFIKETFKLN